MAITDVEIAAFVTFISILSIFAAYLLIVPYIDTRCASLQVQIDWLSARLDKLDETNAYSTESDDYQDTVKEVVKKKSDKDEICDLIVEYGTKIFKSEVVQNKIDEVMKDFDIRKTIH